MSREMEAVFEAIRKLDEAWCHLPDREFERMSRTLKRLATATERVRLSGLLPGYPATTTSPEGDSGSVH